MLRGLDPNARYKLDNFDVEPNETKAGSDLMSPGLSVNISASPGAAVVAYEEVD